MNAKPICRDCCWFSDMVARSEGEVVLALCLREGSPHHGRWQPEGGTCALHEPGEPVDFLGGRV